MSSMNRRRSYFPDSELDNNYVDESDRVIQRAIPRQGSFERHRFVHFDEFSKRGMMSHSSLGPSPPRPLHTIHRPPRSILREPPMAGRKCDSDWERMGREELSGRPLVRTVVKDRPLTIDYRNPPEAARPNPSPSHTTRIRIKEKDSVEDESEQEEWDDESDQEEWDDDELDLEETYQEELDRLKELTQELDALRRENYEKDDQRRREAEDRKKRVDIIYDPSRATRDLTIRLQMDIEEDVERELEEFSRLRRLGRFKDAKAHFDSKLEHLSTIPYFQMLYAEMLLACGDYKTLQTLPSITQFCSLGRLNETSDDKFSRNLVETNYGLLDVLSQRSEPIDIIGVKVSVHSTLTTLSAGPIECSTEVQLLAMCFRVLHYLKFCTPVPMAIGQEDYSMDIFDWEQVYRGLLRESCVWDFRDLFVAAVLIFGWEESSTQLFGTSSATQVLDIISNDWMAPLYNEASTLGLLDLFTSLILQDPSDGMKSRNLLLLQEASALAESAQEHDAELMRSRPFIQWLLAKATLEMEKPPERPDGVRLEDFRGLVIDQGKGVHLPIFVPSRHTNTPDWDMFSSRSSDAIRRVVEVAAGAAHHIGDYTLQAEALKLLVLQSRDPRRWMETLSHLQLETQGDKEGYLATCLARYLVSTEESEEAILLRELVKLDGARNELYSEQCEKASLTWAWNLIRIHLTSSDQGSGANSKRDQAVAEFFERSYLDGSNLPPYIADFVRKELGIPISLHMRGLASRLHGANPAENPLMSNHIHIGNPKRSMAGLWGISTLNGPRLGTPPPPPPPPPQPEEGSKKLDPGQSSGWRKDMERVWHGYKDRSKSQTVPRPSSPPQRRQRSLDRVRGWLEIDDASEEYENAVKLGEEKNKAGQKNPTEAQSASGNGLDSDKSPPGSKKGSEPGQGQTSAAQSQNINKAEGEQRHQSSIVGNDGPNSKAQIDAIGGKQKIWGEEDGNGNGTRNASKAQSDAIGDEQQTQAEEDRNDNGTRNASKADSGSVDGSQPMRVEEDQNGLTNIQFSRDLLEDNHMAVVVWDRKGLHRSKTYIVDEGGVLEAKPKDADTAEMRQGAPTLNIRTRADRVGTGDSGRSTSKRQPSMDKAKRGSLDMGGPRDGGRRKRETTDRWQDWWFPPREGAAKAKTTIDVNTENPWATPGPRPPKGGSGRKKRDRLQDWWFSPEKRATEPTAGDETTDPWSAHGSGLPRDGAGPEISGAGEGVRSLAERFEPRVKELKEQKGKEKEVGADGRSPVPPSSLDPRTEEGPEFIPTVVLPTDQQTSDETRPSYVETMILPTDKRTPGATSSDADGKNCDAETGDKDPEGTGESKGGHGVTVVEEQDSTD